MDRRLAWSPEAAEDIEAIAHYIERDSAQYARTVASRIVATVESISEHPRMGRMVPEINDPDIRERFVHKYRLVYKIELERILIVGIIHGSKDFAEHVPTLKGEPKIQNRQSS